MLRVVPSATPHEIINNLEQALELAAETQPVDPTIIYKLLNLAANNINAFTPEDISADLQALALKILQKSL